jgi:DtxR family Mn-dependent transcriptional regulator
LPFTGTKPRFSRIETLEITLSKTERELLKAVYRMSQNGARANTSEIAEQLKLAPGTLIMAVKRLADRGVLVHLPYIGVELTAKGHLTALSAIRRHRIVERFLADMLGYEWHDADRLAKHFEHQLPREVEDRLFAALNNPQTCPHGHPIPELDASEVGEPLRLTELAPGDAAVIALPNDMDGEVIAFLDTLGVRPGAQIELREKPPSDGPVVVRVNGEDRTVGEQLADRIQVLPGVRTEEIVL